MFNSKFSVSLLNGILIELESMINYFIKLCLEMHYIPVFNVEECLR